MTKMPCDMKAFSGLRLAALLLSVCIASPNAAYAAAIVNITDNDTPMEVKIGQEWKPITIRAGGRFFIRGDARFRWKNREVYIQYDEEYALWPDGMLGPQRKLRFLGASD